MPQTILVHAHRGGRAFRPENTLPAFRYGMEQGADALELDLAVTADNILVVSHSPYLTEPTPVGPAEAASEARERHCDGPALPPGTPIRTLTLAQLRQYDCGAHTPSAFPQQIAVPHTPIPTFDEVLALAPLGHFDFNVETKIFPNHPEFTPTPEVFVGLIDDAVKRHSLQARMILQSFDFRTLRVMKRLNPEVRLSALFGEVNDDSRMGFTDPNRSFLHMAETSGAGILSPDAGLVTPENVAAAHRVGLQIVPYTVNTATGWQRMADAQVDAIITDDPAGLLAWLRAQTPPLHR